MNQNVRALSLTADKIKRRSNYQNKGVGSEFSLDARQINTKLQKPDPTIVNGQRAIKFRGRKMDCRICELRPKCLKSQKAEFRQVYFCQAQAGAKPETFTEKMKRKIDSIKGRLIYNRRLGTAEPASMLAAVA